MLQYSTTTTELDFSVIVLMKKVLEYKSVVGQKSITFNIPRTCNNFINLKNKIKVGIPEWE